MVPDDVLETRVIDLVSVGWRPLGLLVKLGPVDVNDDVPRRGEDERSVMLADAVVVNDCDVERLRRASDDDVDLEGVPFVEDAVHVSDLRSSEAERVSDAAVFELDSELELLTSFDVDRLDDERDAHDPLDVLEDPDCDLVQVREMDVVWVCVCVTDELLDAHDPVDEADPDKSAEEDDFDTDKLFPVAVS